MYGLDTFFRRARPQPPHLLPPCQNTPVSLWKSQEEPLTHSVCLEECAWLRVAYVHTKYLAEGEKATLRLGNLKG